jgi:hypothetical protein
LVSHDDDARLIKEEAREVELNTPANLTSSNQPSSQSTFAKIPKDKWPKANVARVEII